MSANPHNGCGPNQECPTHKLDKPSDVCKARQAGGKDYTTPRLNMTDPKQHNDSEKTSETTTLAKRPKAYDKDALVPVICDLIAHGKSMTDIAKLEGMPSAPTMCVWAGGDDAHAKALARAREAGLDVMADSLVSLADEPVQDKTDVAHRRLRIDTRLRVLRALIPAVWGDRIAVDAQVDTRIALFLDMEMSAHRASTIDVTPELGPCHAPDGAEIEAPDEGPS